MKEFYQLVHKWDKAHTCEKEFEGLLNDLNTAGKIFNAEIAVYNDKKQVKQIEELSVDAIQEMLNEQNQDVAGVDFVLDSDDLEESIKIGSAVELFKGQGIWLTVNYDEFFDKLPEERQNELIEKWKNEGLKEAERDEREESWLFR